MVNREDAKDWQSKFQRFKFQVRIADGPKPKAESNQSTNGLVPSSPFSVGVKEKELTIVRQYSIHCNKNVVPVPL